MSTRDAIDFGKEPIPRLLLKLLWPTLLGLMFSAMFNIVDGIFVGRGVGSDALAAVNIAAPAFMIATGISLMLGSGVSVVAAIHLSKGNVKAANINVTQAFTVGLLLMTVVATLIFLFPSATCHLFGGSARLEPYVTDYLVYIAPTMLCTVLLMGGMFVIRLDGSPKFAMSVNIVAAVLNIFLDWLFVFPLHMGIAGAAIATTIAEVVGTLMIIWYMTCRSKTLHWYKPKFSRRAIRLTVRNVGYMAGLGLSTFIGETAISCTMIVGNYMYISMLHEDGVAAFSVACYLLPLVFMFGNAIAQSALPIISYNHGLGQNLRVRQTIRLSVILAVVCGIILSVLGIVYPTPLINMFLVPGTAAHDICVKGFPLFAMSFLFFSLNIVLIGCYQSLEKARAATTFMLLRGYIFILPCFMLLPHVIGSSGLWLAIPVSEVVTLLCIAATYAWKRKAH